MGKISKNFTLEEFYDSIVAANHNVNNTPHQGEINAICNLVEKLLQPLRTKYGQPIVINSGYRCPELNRLVGGAKNSQHLTGEAADITTGSRDTNKILFNMIRYYFDFDQLIDEKNMQWIHVSLKANGNNRHQVLKL